MLAWFRRDKDDPSKLLDDALDRFELPTFRRIVLAAMSKLRDPDASVAEIGDVLAQDPGLSAKLLRLANSPAYGLRHKVDNVQHAVSMLGRGEVEAMVIGAGVGEQLPQRPLDGYEPVRFWRAATQRAAAARALAAALHPATKAECFTAGLLQDMAVPMLIQARGADYVRVLARSRAGEAPLVELEEAAFGWNHAFIAGAMAERWGFPADLVDAIGGHHDAWEGGEAGPRTPHAVSLVAMLDETDAPDPETEPMIDVATDRFSIDRRTASTLVENALREADGLVGGFL